MGRSRLSAGERRRLLKLLKRPQDARLYRRALAVLEWGRGKAVAEIAELLQVSRQSIYNWLGHFQQTQDVWELADAPRSGRPPRWNNAAEAQLKALLNQTPEQMGYVATHWTVPLLREQLWHGTGERYSEATIRRGLHQLGYVWKRPRYVLAPDPEREKKTPNYPPHQWLAETHRAARHG